MDNLCYTKLLWITLQFRIIMLANEKGELYRTTCIFVVQQSGEMGRLQYEGETARAPQSYYLYYPR